MSWDIILFNSSQKIVSLENLDEDLLKPIDFDKILKSSFDKVKTTENHIEIIGKDFTIEFFEDEEVESFAQVSPVGRSSIAVVDAKLSRMRSNLKKTFQMAKSPNE